MENSSHPILDHLNDFLDWLDIEKGLSNLTQKNYARFVKPFTSWLKLGKLEGLKPHELTAEHIWEYRVYLSRKYRPRNKDSLKKSTQNYYLIVLRSLLNFFADRDIASLPSEKIKLARDKDDREVRFLDLDQLEKLFAVPDTRTTLGLRDRAILEVFFSTGMRISELTALERDQVKIHENQEYFELGIVGKGGRARTVYFSARAIVWLNRYLQRRHHDDQKALFINYRSRGDAPRRLTPRSIEKMIKRCALKSGLPLNTTPHVLRHSFATDLLSNGVDLRTIQEFLGHKNISATQIYAHVTNKKLREVHQKFHGSGKL